MKWFIGVSSAIVLAFCAWLWAFVLMGYQARADIETLQDMAQTSIHERSQLKADIQSVKAISERTEKNTEQIRDYLLNRAVK